MDKITAWWKKFNTKQRSVLISIVAVVIVALVILGVVISRPTQVELVEAQSASEASTIKGVLEDNNISYEVDSKLVFFVNKSDEVNAIQTINYRQLIHVRMEWKHLKSSVHKSTMLLFLI